MQNLSPAEKARLEREHSQQMNNAAVERARRELEEMESQRENNNTDKKEVITKEEAKRIESVFFEDDAEITLRDGKTYKIPPCTLRDARRLMQLIKIVNVDIILMNFVPDGEGFSEERIEALYELLGLGFKNYPHVDEDYLDRYVDLELAKEIIDILIGLNGLKKSK